jgi:hypothetical protein
METDLLLLAAAVGVAVVLLCWRLCRSLRHRPAGPYTSRGTLLSRGELAFYRVLRQAVPAGVLVCPKVRVADLVTWAASAWHSHGRPLTGKHVDFVLADADTTQILLVVELDDKTHKKRDRKKRDCLVDAALTTAGIAIVRVPAAAAYDARQLRAILGKARGRR